MMKNTFLSKFPDKIGYLLILPFYAVFVYFWFMPLIQVFLDSFADISISGRQGFVGLGNYAKTLGDVYFRRSVGNTLEYAAGTLLPTLVLGFFAALLVNSRLIRTGAARTVLFIPHVVSMIAVSMVWLLIYDPNFGYFNRLLEMVGLPPSRWLQSPDTAMLSIIIMSVWKSIGYTMIIYLAGLQSIPASYYEVAAIEGANFWQLLRYVILPAIAPTTMFLFVTGLIGSFNVFEQVNVLTSGGPADATTTVMHQIFVNAFTHYKIGYASAQSVLLFLVIVMATGISMYYGNKSEDAEIG